MPRYIIKPKPDEDFYVLYSTIVDAPVGWGSRADMMHLGKERIARADNSGSSLYPPIGKWDKTEFMVREGFGIDRGPDDGCFAMVKREDLRAFCAAVNDKGEFTPTPDNVRDTYIVSMRRAFVASAGDHGEEFDRWLKEHDREVLRRAVTGRDREAKARILDPDAWELTYAEFRLKYGTFSDADPKSQQRRRDRSMIDALIALTP